MGGKMDCSGWRGLQKTQIVKRRRCSPSIKTEHDSARADNCGPFIVINLAIVFETVQELPQHDTFMQHFHIVTAYNCPQR
jgi:hypothetical protein